MNLVLYIILKLLSRPVVCADFQGLEANTFFPASGVCQGYSIEDLNLRPAVKNIIILLLPQTNIKVF
jgi:hypothetical protein